MSPPAPPDPNFEIHIILPIPRGSFVDPTNVQWSSEKDQRLRQAVSSASRAGEINWDSLAIELDVSREFLLQQAAWLYERDLNQVRAQMARAGQGGLGLGSGTAEGMSRGESLGATGMVRGLSGRSNGEAPSFPQLLERQTRLQRLSNDSRPSSSANARPQTSTAPLPSVTSAGTASTATRPDPPTPRPSYATLNAPHSYADRSASPSDLSESSTSSEGQMVGRQSLLQHLGRAGGSGSSDEEDEGDNAFLPFTADGPPRTVISGTSYLRDPTTSLNANTQQANPPIRNIQRLRSQPGSGPGTNNNSVNPSPPSTVSIGSSFSDLSDASVSQSAMEEAYLNMGGTMASRMSTMSRMVQNRFSRDLGQG